MGAKAKRATMRQRGTKAPAAGGPGAAVAEVQIERLGARGDGIATLAGGPVFVPLSAPGDRLRIALGDRRGEGTAGEIAEVLAASALRRTAPCRHFGDCGGCAVQHVDDDTYAAWKRDLVVAALAHRGLRDAEVAAPVRVAAGTRRRVTLSAVGQGGRVLLGFNARSAHRVVDLHDCVVAAPALVALLAPLRAALAPVLRDREHADIVATMSDSGADLLLVTARAPDLRAREALAAFAEAQDVSRLSWSAPGEPAEPIAWRRPARITFAGVAVEPPPGAFLQPTAAGEAALVGAVAAGLRGAGTVADLFAGCGTFTFPLAAAGASVHAVEAVPDSVAAIRRAAAQAGLARVATEVRDLERKPLLPDEVRRYDAVVIDPPRAGARAQCEMLARSTVSAIAAVSCNPATFARDARILVDAGFRMGPVTPVDQFLWSAHVELVAIFRR